MYNGTNAFTVPATGTYNINAWSRLADRAPSAADTTGILIYRNGVSTNNEGWNQPDSSSGRRCTFIQCTIALTAADIIAVNNYQTSGVAINANRMNFTMVRVG